MKITKSNFESFFLDFWEGNLDANQKNNLAEFLSQNPLLQDVFLDFREVLNIKLPKDDLLLFPNPESLKKPLIISTGTVNEENYTEWFIAYLEGDLSEMQLKQLMAFLQFNPHLNYDLDLFRLTFLKPDHHIQYPDKENLKQHRKIVMKHFAYFLGLAATILLLLTLFLLPSNTKIENHKEVAQTVPAPISLKPIANPHVTIFNTEVSQNLKGSGENENARMVSVKKREETLPTNYAIKTKTDFDLDYLNQKTPVNIDQKLLVGHIKPISTTKIVVAGSSISAGNPIIEQKSVIDFDWQPTHLQPERGLLTRIAANIGRKIFGATDENDQPASLLVEAAYKGIETFQEFREFATTPDKQDGELKTDAVLALGDRFAIRIARGNREVQNDFQ